MNSKKVMNLCYEIWGFMLFLCYFSTQTKRKRKTQNSKFKTI